MLISGARLLDDGSGHPQHRVGVDPGLGLHPHVLRAGHRHGHGDRPDLRRIGDDPAHPPPGMTPPIVLRFNASNVPVVQLR